MIKKVKAAVLVKPNRIIIQEFPYPKLEEGCIMVKMKMSGICGTDKHLYKGENKLYVGTEREIAAPYPIILGHENLGIIAELNKLGEKRLDYYGQELNIGDRVVMGCDINCGTCYECRHGFGYSGWCKNLKTYGVTISCKKYPHLFGGWAEYMYVTPKVHVFKVPKELSDEEAVLTELMANTYALDKAKEFFAMPNEGFACMDTVLILGVGPLGLLNVAKARILGAGDIIVIDKSEFRIKMSKKLGADYGINADKLSKKERIKIVKDLTEGRGADVVIDCIGLSDIFLEGLEMLSNGGIFIEQGAHVETGKNVTFNIHRHLLAKSARIIGMNNHPSWGYLPSMKLMKKHGKQIPFQMVVTDKYKIDEAERAIIRSTDLDTMKVVIIP